MNGYRDAKEAFEAVKGNVCMVCGDVADCFCGSCNRHCSAPIEHIRAMRREGTKQKESPPDQTHEPLAKDNVKVWARECFGKPIL
jgi:hypothetical protein